MADTPTRPGTAIPPTPGDTLIFENDRVRVWSMTLEPGGMFDFHQHHHDHVVIWPAAGNAQGQELGDDEWGITQHAEPGFVLYKTVGSAKPLNPHRIRNLGNETVTHYVVELLETSPSETELPWQHNDRGSFTTPADR
ncbi:hypothetical protein [Williamsia sp. DF01-3]|uniref:hypothetical protein n=1 Tax=Williamsia sp. DF01-3 TaxID=2934157 RepID=UPI001FF2FD7A|nr:hypothetical protein [Williamsia sp. DF01-3]MCK0516519.1 hypothetical protein [Williamsia sp. DF01-3]